MDFKNWAKTIPAWMGTPTFSTPEPPKFWIPSHMDLYPSEVMRKLGNELIEKGINVEDAYKHAKEVALFVHDYSLNPKNVYKRVLKNTFDRTNNLEVAKKIANNAVEKAKKYEQ